MSIENMQPLTRREASHIKCPTERFFALLCLSKLCIVYHQVPVGASTIDFFIINPRIKDNPGGIYVEVTLYREFDCSASRTIGKRKNRRDLSSTRKRKLRQKAAMESSGNKGIILYGQSMMRLMSLHRNTL